MKKQSNVTVIIPCYNDGAYIEQAINSILNQTLKADKIIVVDDGSDEATKAVLKKTKVENIEIIYQENQGVSEARNTGIALAKTNYILTLDADDFFESTFIEKAVYYLNHNPTIGVVGCYYKTFKANKFDKEIIKPLGGSVKNFLLKNNGLGTSLFRKTCWEKVSGYDEKMKNGYEDWEFWIAILSNGWSMYIIEEPLFNYRLKKESRDQIAVKEFDFELRNYMFLKHKEVYKKYFEFYSLGVLHQNSLLKKKVRKTKNSIDYKIGKYVLKPFRLLKNTIFRG